MNGLDKLKEKIIDEAKQTAEAIIKSANTEADRIIKTAREVARAEETAVLKEADKKAMIIVRSAESNANLDGKKKVLKEKRKIISGVFEKAAENIKAMPANEYFNIIYELVKKCKNSGELMLSENDKERIPDDFADKISEMSNGNIKVSKEFAKISNGFILRSGLTDENYSFDAVIEENIEILQDKTAKLLFS